MRKELCNEPSNNKNSRRRNVALIAHITSAAKNQPTDRPALSGFRSFRGLFSPTTLWRLGDETLLDRFRGHADVAHFAVNNSFDALQIRDETALGDSGHVRADAAFFLGLTTAPDMTALDRAFAG
jgi:hypothetical protein